MIQPPCPPRKECFETKVKIKVKVEVKVKVEDEVEDGVERQRHLDISTFFEQ